MPSQRVLMMVKVNVAGSLLSEFNELWGRENLPAWEEHGAKHIGSFVHSIGGPINEIIRLFEYEDFSQWEKFMEWRNEMFWSEKGQKRQQMLSRYIINLEEKLLTSIY